MSTRSVNVMNGSGGLSWKAIGMIVGIVSLLLAAHSTIVVPTILHHVDRLLVEDMDRHESRLHPGSVSKAELQTVMTQITERLAGVATKESVQAIGTRLDSIERRLERLEQK